MEPVSLYRWVNYNNTSPELTHEQGGSRGGDYCATTLREVFAVRSVLAELDCRRGPRFTAKILSKVVVANARAAAAIRGTI
jgi:hypothetical protein